MNYYLGVDGGGSKTKAVLTDENGTVAAYAEGIGINYNAVGMEKARKHLKDVIDRLTEGFPAQICAAVIGCAALSGRADTQTTDALCSGIVPSSRVFLDSDVFIAQQAIPGDGPKAIAICGTGSMASVLYPDGTRACAGGWGYLLGDEGSGYAIAVEAIKAALRASEGAGAQTELTNAVCSCFDLRHISDIIDHFYSPAFSRDRVAAFAPAVFACADNGDAIAVRIINTQAQAFADTVAPLLKDIPNGTPLYVWGGIFQHNQRFRSAFSAAVKRLYPLTETLLLPQSPEIAAAKTAVNMEKCNG